MAGSVTLRADAHGLEFSIYTLTWLSDGSGNVSGNPFLVVFGRLRQVQIVPDAGSTQPTDGYDMTLVDARGIDLLAGFGENLSNALGKKLLGSPAVIIEPNVTLDLRVASGGAGKGGTVVLWVNRL